MNFGVLNGRRLGFLTQLLPLDPYAAPVRFPPNMNNAAAAATTHIIQDIFTILS
jgi:hypothetical protein